MTSILVLVVENWEVLGLIITNICALFVPPPKKKKLFK